MDKFIVEIFENMVKELPDRCIDEAVLKTMNGMGYGAALRSTANAVNLIESLQPMSGAKEIKLLIVKSAMRYIDKIVDNRRAQLDGQTFLLSILVYLADEYSHRDFCSIVNTITRGWRMKDVAEKLYDVLSFFEIWKIPNGKQELDDFKNLTMEALINRLNYKKTGC